MSLDSTVKPPVPTITITGAPANGHSPEGTAITLGSNVQGTSAGVGYTYAWQVLKNNSPFASGSLAALTFTSDDNATYKATLTLTDSYGQVASASQTIVADNVAPTATITPPSGPVAGIAAAFQAWPPARGSADSSAVLTSRGNFGDNPAAVPGAPPSHT